MEFSAPYRFFGGKPQRIRALGNSLEGPYSKAIFSSLLQADFHKNGALGESLKESGPLGIASRDPTAKHSFSFSLEANLADNKNQGTALFIDLWE
jgi:hypothetical protein